MSSIMNASVQKLANRWYVLLPASALLLVSCSKKPDADFTASANAVEVGQVVSFTDASENAIHYHWDFGDGSPAAEHRNPTHVYNDAGTYTVQLEVADRKFKDVSTFSQEIVVSPNSTDDPFSEGEEERQAIVAELAGFWTIERFTYDYYYNGVVDPLQSTDENYSNSSIDFVSAEMAVHQYESGQVQMEQWGVVTAELVQIQWQMWNIELLGPSDFVISFEQEWEDWSGNTIRQVQKMYLSR